MGLGSRWGCQGTGVPPITLKLCPSLRGIALFKASTLKSMQSHRLAEKKSLAQLKRQ